MIEGEMAFPWNPATCQGLQKLCPSKASSAWCSPQSRWVAFKLLRKQRSPETYPVQRSLLTSGTCFSLGDNPFIRILWQQAGYKARERWSKTCTWVAASACTPQAPRRDLTAVPESQILWDSEKTFQIPCSSVSVMSCGVWLVLQQLWAECFGQQHCWGPCLCSEFMTGPLRCGLGSPYFPQVHKWWWSCWFECLTLSNDGAR